MRTSIISTLICFTLSSILFSQNSIHFFKTQTIYGDEFDFSTLKGKKVLVVNTASKCGLTGQYKDLQELYNRYKEQNFEIVAFPSNDFLGQEPGSNEEIKEFCEANYGVTFLMMSKISVKGKNIDPIYKWLTQKKMNGVLNASVKWNFQKFMIDENGYLVDYASPKENPLSDNITNWIEGMKN